MNSVIERVDSSTCCELQIRDTLKCSNCKHFDYLRMLKPNKVRKSKCKKPWRFDKRSPLGDASPRHFRTLQRIATCWVDIIQNNAFTPDEIPEKIKEVASVVDVILPDNITGTTESHSQIQETIQQETDKEEYEVVLMANKRSASQTPIQQRERQKRSRPNNLYIDTLASTCSSPTNSSSKNGDVDDALHKINEQFHQSFPFVDNTCTVPVEDNQRLKEENERLKQKVKQLNDSIELLMKQNSILNENQLFHLRMLDTLYVWHGLGWAVGRSRYAEY